MSPFSFSHSAAAAAAAADVAVIDEAQPES